MKNKQITKKIITGKFKGKTILLPSKETTRSSKAVVVESFFNTIQFNIIDAVFVEVFAGSGSVGLEALSRGASKIYFMEKDKQALRTLQQNIANTDPLACEVFQGDSFVNISMVVAKLKKENSSAYFYIDPPFSFREGMEDIYEKMLNLIASLPKEHTKLIILEHMTGLELPLEIGIYTQQKSKKFGNTTLTYYKNEEME
ncbi:MAG: 16S rRNA (guanine(966)-N(2))-methyltransferase RsmD [Sulfurimonadaceae bacterium]|jgi:16S rRNA (guanine(966)-N(2))-methyltransferase RsmD|nr:16S rRNA (guanine(966)-N(2))-methyltransferase RsmD [Sulfurimonadaceae bacterium]